MTFSPAHRAYISQALAAGGAVSRDAVAKIRADVAADGEAETVAAMMRALMALPKHRIADVAVSALFTLARTELPEPTVCPDPAGHEQLENAPGQEHRPPAPAAPGRCAWCSLPFDGSLPTKGADQ